MNYRAFADYRKGYAHVKNGSGVEDYASSYNDPESRFYIGVICDGHSDKNCFRSSKGAKFGCESAIEILTRFFELYFMQESEKKELPEGFENRLKRSLKVSWDRKVYNDIIENPIREEELLPLEDRVRKIYASGNGTLNIYGATFLAIGICEDFFLALHIGDGIILCVDENGVYYTPVRQDPKSETGSPASLCDTDLFSREEAFRVCISKKLPQIATASSDGIEDCMDSCEYKKTICGLFKKLESDKSEEEQGGDLNAVQKAYLGSFLEYYAGQGHGAEDDCSLAAFYDLDRLVPELRIPSDEAVQLWERAMRDRNEVVSDYERRKKDLLASMKQTIDNPAFKNTHYKGTDQFMAIHEKFEDQKRILKTILINEKDKVAYFENQLVFYEQYIDNFSDRSAGFTKRLNILDINTENLEPDNSFHVLKIYKNDLQAKLDHYQRAVHNEQKAKMDFMNACDEAKRSVGLNSSGSEPSTLWINQAQEQLQKANTDIENAKAEYNDAKAIYENEINVYINNILRPIIILWHSITDGFFRISRKPRVQSMDSIYNDVKKAEEDQVKKARSIRNEPSKKPH